MQKPEYDSSDDEDDEDDDDDNDVSPEEDEIEAEAEAPQVQQLGRGLRIRKKRTRYVPGSSEFTNANLHNVRDNQGHFAGPGQDGIGVVNMTYHEHKYHLREGVVSFNLSENSGVRAPSNTWMG